jgi:hypothetical protein
MHAAQPSFRAVTFAPSSDRCVTRATASSFLHVASPHLRVRSRTTACTIASALRAMRDERRWVPSSRVRVVSSRRRITSAIGRLVYSLCCVVSPYGSLPKTCLGILIRVARSSATGRRRSSLRVLDAVSASTCCLLLRLVGATEGQRTIRPERQLQSSLPLYSKSPRPSKCSHPQATLAANWATMTLA